jgi:16S rRNA processing protein RimM
MNTLKAGRIVKASGLKGRMKVLSYLESNDVLYKLDTVSIKRGGQLEAFRIKDIRISGKNFSLELDGITDSEKVESYINGEVMIPATLLETLSEGEYYWRDIIGLEVVTEQGDFIGRIETIFSTGSNDVYVCAGGEREILLPGIADVVQEIDVTKGKMIVRLLEGL